MSDPAGATADALCGSRKRVSGPSKEQILDLALGEKRRQLPRPQVTPSSPPPRTTGRRSPRHCSKSAWWRERKHPPDEQTLCAIQDKRLREGFYGSCEPYGVMRRGLSTLVSSQVRSARAALRWSVTDLAKRSGVSISTIKRAEASASVPQITGPNMIAIRTAFEGEGVEFIGTPEDRPGVRISMPPPEK